MGVTNGDTASWLSTDSFAVHRPALAHFSGSQPRATAHTTPPANESPARCHGHDGTRHRTIATTTTFTRRKQQWPRCVPLRPRRRTCAGDVHDCCVQCRPQAEVHVSGERCIAIHDHHTRVTQPDRGGLRSALGANTAGKTTSHAPDEKKSSLNIKSRSSFVRMMGDDIVSTPSFPVDTRQPHACASALLPPRDSH